MLASGVASIGYWRIIMTTHQALAEASREFSSIYYCLTKSGFLYSVREYSVHSEHPNKEGKLTVKTELLRQTEESYIINHHLKYTHTVEVDLMDWLDCNLSKYGLHNSPEELMEYHK